LIKLKDSYDAGVIRWPQAGWCPVGLPCADETRVYDANVVVSEYEIDAKAQR